MSESILSATTQEIAEVMPVVSPVALVDFGRSDEAPKSDPVVETKVDLQIVLGGTVLKTAEADQLGCGSIVPLDESVDAPVSVFADGRLLARGELVALDNHYALRITELAPDPPTA